MTPALGRLLLFGFWVLPAALATLAFLWVPSRYNPSLGFGGLFASQLMIWMPWGIWSLCITALSKRVPLERGRLVQSLLAHLALGAVVLPAEMLVISATTRAFGLVATDAPTHLDSVLAIGFRQYGDMLFVVYCAVVGADTAWRWYGRWREASLREARLGEDLAQARFEALRAQLNPHFLFNALNAVVALIDHDPEAAQRMTIRLADLLRATLASGDVQESSLREEIELTARYLEIEQVRFADRLTVSWDVAPDLDTLRVPTFALQPLVENAIRHGISRRPGAGVIEIGARQEGGRVRLHVSDDGYGLEPSADVAPPRAGAGIALRNLRARLERLYGAQSSLTLTPRAGGGTIAEITVPSSDTRAVSAA